jgi:diacylglycerol kinase
MVALFAASWRPEVSMAISPRNPLALVSPSEAPRPPQRRRPWRRKFGEAFRGLKLGIRGQSSFSVHFFFTALVVAAAVALGCELLEWCLLLACIGMVLVAELFNSAVETLFRGLDEATRQRAWPCLDIAAGAVLLASIVAVIIGSLIFLSRLAPLLSLSP